MIIFTYGTLKRGFGNHEVMIHNKFLGEATSKYKYPMVNIEGTFPYLINEKGYGKHIKGEVFEIDDITEQILDLLEGYPNLYTKEVIEVLINDKEVEAMAYFVKEKINYTDLELLDEFYNL
jgi:gamma-glutamylaminecyclotransferase